MLEPRRAFARYRSSQRVAARSYFGDPRSASSIDP
jgi:hypothetical protein